MRMTLALTCPMKRWSARLQSPQGAPDHRILHPLVLLRLAAVAWATNSVWRPSSSRASAAAVVAETNDQPPCASGLHRARLHCAAGHRAFSRSRLRLLELCEPDLSCSGGGIMGGIGESLAIRMLDNRHFSMPWSVSSSAITTVRAWPISISRMSQNATAARSCTRAVRRNRSRRRSPRFAPPTDAY